MLVSRNTCSPKSSESAERKRAPHVCALNDVQESDHAPCNTCKCPHLNCCDCSCLHIQQTPLSDASQDICKPPSRLDRPCVPIQQAETNHFLMRLGIHLQVHPALIAFAFPSSRSRQNQFLMRLETHMQAPVPPRLDGPCVPIHQPETNHFLMRLENTHASPHPASPRWSVRSHPAG